MQPSVRAPDVGGTILFYSDIALLSVLQRSSTVAKKEAVSERGSKQRDLAG